MSRSNRNHPALLPLLVGLHSFAIASHWLAFTWGFASISLLSLLFHFVNTCALTFVGKVACDHLGPQTRYANLTPRQTVSAVIGLNLLNAVFPSWVMHRVGLYDTLIGWLFAVYIFGILWWLIQPARADGTKQS
jgi:hypothetical protein